MPTHSLATSPSTSDDWASPADRQAAARQAYRRSVADGRPLTGVELGKQFGLSPRWGTSRIAEVRAEDIGRHDGSNANGVASPIRNSRAGRGGNGGKSLPIDINGSSRHSAAGFAASLEQHSGSHGARHTLPFGTDGNGPAVPNGNHCDGAHASDAPGPTVGHVPHGASSPRTTGTETVTAERSAGGESTRGRRSRSLLDTAITILVAGVAFAASYGHMFEVALTAGEHPWIAAAFPVTVDGLVLAALRRGERGRRWLALGAAASIVANVLAQFPEWAAAAGPIVSAWPPLALYGTHRLLHGRAQARRHDPAVES
jgi:hypothetical protein